MARTAAPNGYSVSVILGSMSTLPHLQKVDYNPVTDFTYFIGLPATPMASPSRPTRPWAPWADLPRLGGSRHHRSWSSDSCELPAFSSISCRTRGDGHDSGDAGTPTGRLGRRGIWPWRTLERCGCSRPRARHVNPAGQTPRPWGNRAFARNLAVVGRRAACSKAWRLRAFGARALCKS